MRFQLHLLLLFLLTFQVSSGQAMVDPSPDLPGKGTQEMAAYLRKLVAEGRPMDYIHWNRARAHYHAEQARNGPQNERRKHWFLYCYEVLNSGNPQAAIDELHNHFSRYGKPFDQLLTYEVRPLYELWGLSFLRLGENENCQAAHSPASCILPLQGGGLHQLKKGSENAMAIFRLLQQRFPDDKTKWLLNLAAMTLDQYPGGLTPEELLTYPNWEREQKDFPRFEEVAMEVGLAENGISGGTCMEDFNRDGHLDIFATEYGMDDQCKLFFSDGKGGYTDVTEQAGLTGMVSGLNCLQADYDNDGWVDILVLRGAWCYPFGKHPNSLLRNMGDGTFQDVTRAAGLWSLNPTQAAAWADYDRDGDLDLFIGNESAPEVPHPCELFENQGDGTFKEVAREHGLGSILEFVKGCAWGDIDNDGWPDLYISLMGGNNLLYRNVEGKFLEIGQLAGVQEPFYSFPCWFWDVNNDGLQDIYVASYDLPRQDILAGDFARELQGLPGLDEKSCLFINNGDLTFSDKTKEFNLDRSMYAMGANFGDLDNDGFLDFYIGTGAPDFSTVVPNRMFHNLDGKGFEEVTSAGNFGHIQKGHGVAFGDMDRDGDQDIYMVVGGGYEGDEFTNILYENPISDNNWIVVELEGWKSNRKGIGCRIAIELTDGRQVHRTVGTGGSFGSSSLQQEIGLGQAEIKSLTVTWTDSSIQEFKKVPVNAKVIINEGEKKWKLADYERVPFRKGEHSGHHHH